MSIRCETSTVWIGLDSPLLSQLLELRPLCLSCIRNLMSYGNRFSTSRGALSLRVILGYSLKFQSTSQEGYHCNLPSPGILFIKVGLTLEEECRFLGRLMFTANRSNRSRHQLSPMQRQRPRVIKVEPLERSQTESFIISIIKRHRHRLTWINSQSSSSCFTVRVDDDHLDR
jgi:hypothetical protein